MLAALASPKLNFFFFFSKKFFEERKEISEMGRHHLERLLD